MRAEALTAHLNNLSSSIETVFGELPTPSRESTATVEYSNATAGITQIELESDAGVARGQNANE